MMDALSVVTQLCDLASEPQNREVIVRDQGCLPGLVLFLDHKSPEVLLATLRTLRYLAEMPSNIPTMKNELGMMVSLENLFGRDDLSVDIISLAKEIYDILESHNLRPATSEGSNRQKRQFFFKCSNKSAKSVTLHIQGLESVERRSLCEDALLKVKGVISFTFQMNSKRCTVRIRSDLPTESLATAIAATNVLTAQQVVKNEMGDEVLVPLEVSGAQVQQNCAVPDYLPEDEDSPEKDLSRAVSRTTAKEDSSGSWLNAAAGFLTRTFYW